jgi:hypothetical protein
MLDETKLEISPPNAQKHVFKNMLETTAELEGRRIPANFPTTTQFCLSLYPNDVLQPDWFVHGSRGTLTKMHYQARAIMQLY